MSTPSSTSSLSVSGQRRDVNFSTKNGKLCNQGSFGNCLQNATNSLLIRNVNTMTEPVKKPYSESEWTSRLMAGVKECGGLVLPVVAHKRGEPGWPDRMV